MGATVFGAASNAAAQELEPVLLAGDAFPGDPDRALGLEALIGDFVPGTVADLDSPLRGPPSYGQADRPPAGMPQVRLGHSPVDVRGSLPREVIQRVVRSHVRRMRYCYERELARNPSLAGTVTVQFIIGAAGRVQMPRRSRKRTRVRSLEVTQAMKRV